MERKIVFITEMRDPTKDASSTQIMTRNLISGFRELTEELVLVAVLNNNTDTDNVDAYYSSYVDTIIYTHAVTKGGGRIRNTASMLFSCFHSTYESYEKILNEVSDQTILISQSPSIDTAILCKLIMKHKSPKKYVQYWGDPMALSLITPQEYNIHRMPAYFIERHLHQFADSVVYGTKPLYIAQKELFKRTKNVYKFAYADVAYKPNNLYSRTNKERTFGYLGNYYSRIRNITPLFEAFCLNANTSLVIYGQSDLVLSEHENIRVHERVSQEEIEQIENQIDVDICILNRIGIQIPGKLFYQTNTDKIIWVIVDGPEANSIVDYLREFDRFVFSDNSVQSIQETMEEIKDGKYDRSQPVCDRLTPASVCKCIINGGYK